MPIPSLKERKFHYGFPMEDLHSTYTDKGKEDDSNTRSQFTSAKGKFLSLSPSGTT
jgi:hypothetical protein